MRMKIEIFDEEREDEKPLWEHLARVEKDIAAEEGRAPEGWFWVEGMEKPQPLFPKSEEAP